MLTRLTDDGELLDGIFEADNATNDRLLAESGLLPRHRCQGTGLWNSFVSNHQCGLLPPGPGRLPVQFGGSGCVVCGL